MATTSPSWFESWPAAFPDIQAIAELVFPRQYPRGLYEDTTDEYADIKAQAQVLNWVQQGSMWIRRRLWPEFDTSGIFLEYWETAFRIVARSSAALRKRAIHIIARHRSTATEEQVQAIFADVFDIDKDRITFTSPTPAAVAAACATNSEASHWAFLQNNMHISDSSRIAEPDQALGYTALEQTKQAQQHWSFGKRDTLIWGVHANDGEWDMRTWG